MPGRTSKMRGVGDKMEHFKTKPPKKVAVKKKAVPKKGAKTKPPKKGAKRAPGKKAMSY